jgi:hypothetical protein
MANSSRTAAQKKAALERSQAARFIEAAREAGCSEDEAEIRESMKRIAGAKPKTKEADAKDG